MCNLYRMTKTPQEVSNWFSAIDNLGGVNLSAEVYPGYPGLVIANGELRKMTWGFPLTLNSKKTGEPLKPKPVNNTRSDKLDSFMWRYSFEERRCLIPISAWAEAEGPKGGKTRTWLSVPGEELFAVAGIWRDSEEWGPVYSMVMTEASDEVSQVHNRMPVILSSESYGEWCSGSTQEAKALCQPWLGEFSIERTLDPWFKR